MATRLHVNFGHLLGKAASTVAVVALSVATTLFVQHVLTPTTAAARALQEQAHDTTYIVPGGTGMLARLGPGGLGNGNLRLWDTSGNLRVELAADGTAHIWDANGNVLWSV